MTMRYKILSVLFSFCTLLASSQSALIVKLEEKNGDLWFTPSGSLDLSGAFFSSFGVDLNTYRFSGTDAQIVAGVADVRYFSGVTSLSGPPVAQEGSLTSGSTLGYETTGSSSVGVWVPIGYASGNPYPVATAVVSGLSFSDLGVMPGDSWGVTWPGDSISFTVVPEPSAMTLGVTMILALIAKRRRRICSGRKGDPGP